VKEYLKKRSKPEYSCEEVVSGMEPDGVIWPFFDTTDNRVKSSPGAGIVRKRGPVSSRI
jgi:hypothetical protein